jgi:lipopolysaccharide biosynthesis regulator YciM
VKPKSFLFPLVLIVISLKSFGQLGIDYDVKKPAKYENRKLGYEKTTETKFKVPRHFLQNTVTHYNYYFNANVKINEVLAGAKSRNIDDYSKLLPFYNYNLDATAGFSRDLDSVIFKCNTGILIHDLRNDWVDNLYMLMGRAYYYKKNMDSAYVIFQFVNTAFAPKEEDGYPKYIASNANREEGGSAFIVSTDEKRNIVKRTFSLPPSRNESLIWQIRTFIARNQYDKAASLIEVLKLDPQFPVRLIPDLEEVQANLFYKVRMWDSAAFHLVKALPKAEDRQELARWEYLIGQLYDRANEPALSKTYFEKASQDTYSPVLDVNARLNAILQNRTGGTEKEDFIQKNIDALNKLARKEIYADYRDIIYFAAGQMELQRKRVPAAINDFMLSTRNALPNSPTRNRSFVQLGDLAFNSKKYIQAKSFYDSVNTQDPEIIGDPQLWAAKKMALGKIVVQLKIIRQQDSLLAIADLTPADRAAYIKKLVRQLRKQQGLAEEGAPGSINQPFNMNNKSGSNLFSQDASAEWYFNNTSLKAKGFTEFKSVWGNRPNVDNWFLSSAMSRQGLGLGKPGQGQVSGENEAPSELKDNEITSAKLLANLPLTPEKRQKTLDSIERAYFVLGKNYQNEIPDYPYAINAYDSVLIKFPESKLTEETYYNIYVCYKMLGDNENAARILDIMKQRFASGKFLRLIIDPDAINKSENNVRIHATREYDHIYTDFIEGNFDQALDRKKISDSLYGSKYWTPQLLYIESIYFIHERRDAEAGTELNNIIKRFPNTAMAARAKNLIDVLSRRQQIEDYLTNLKIKRPPEDSSATVAARRQSLNGQKDSTQRGDSSAFMNAKASKLAANVDQIQKSGIANPSDRKLNLVAPVTKISVDPAKLAMLQRRADSLQLAMKKAKNDADKLAYLKFQNDSIQAVLSKMRADSAQAAAAKISTLKTSFSYAPEQPLHVAIIMNKVDPVYISEARNAFNRFNKEEYYGKNFQVVNASLDDSIKLVLIEGFENNSDAVSYLEKARKLAPAEILPWLPAAKYSFIVITDQNLVVLTANKDLDNYRKFLSVYYPGKF